MRTTHVKAADTEPRWLLYDASQLPLGRLAARIATNLRGTDRPTFTYSESGNTHVVVINAERAVLTGKKSTDKEYQHYTGYPGGRRVQSVARMREKRPADMVQLAVRRMLPKSRLGRELLSNLKVYAGPEHPHAAQQPVPVSVQER